MKRPKYIVPYLADCGTHPIALTGSKSVLKIYWSLKTAQHEFIEVALLFIGSWNWKHMNQSGLKYLLNTCSFTCYGHDGSQEF